MATFVAVDFETADRYRDSACAIAMVRVEGRRIVAREYRLVRPPRREFETTWCHGITWDRVKAEPTFPIVWRSLAPVLAGAEFIAAHNASFERSVINACCQSAGIAAPTQRFECTVKLARDTWDLRPTALPDVCRHLGLRLQHHHALSDAEACARIVLAAGTPAAKKGATPRAKKTGDVATNPSMRRAAG